MGGIDKDQSGLLDEEGILLSEALFFLSRLMPPDSVTRSRNKSDSAAFAALIKNFNISLELSRLCIPSADAKEEFRISSLAIKAPVEQKPIRQTNQTFQAFVKKYSQNKLCN